MEKDFNEIKLRKISLELRKLILSLTFNAGSGHPGPSFSIVDILTYLYFFEMDINPKDPDYFKRDRFILSKGHAAPALYSALYKLGFFPEEEMKMFRKVGGCLGGHPCIKTPGVDMSSGSLGTGLSVACGLAYGLKKLNIPSYVYGILGDGEMDEGQIWEAALFASHNKLDNLIFYVDRNRYQFEGSTETVLGLEPIKLKWEAFGWEVREVNGHDYLSLFSSMTEIKRLAKRPKIIIAETIKGKGVSFMENNQDFHARAPNKAEFILATQELDEQIAKYE